MRRYASIAAFIVAAATLASCAQQVDDIDRTQPNKILKSDLDGIWYMMETVTSVPPTSAATFIGETSKTEKIKWKVERDLLLAYRSYPLVPGTDDVDGGVDYDARDYHESPVAAFTIQSHFDIQRSYDSSTGEQTNVLVENSSDRPWYDRDYMRVDWSMNRITNLDFVSEWLATPIEASYSIEAERLDDGSIYFERGEGGLAYFDVPRRLLVEPDWYGCIISSPWYGWGTEDCTAAEIEVVSAFAKTPNQRDYEPQPYGDQDLARFGYFRSERYVHDPKRGVLESTRQRMINRHNIWRESYVKDSVGEYVRNDAGERIPIPVEEREVRTVPYYMSTTYPEDPLITEAAIDVMEQWNAVGKEAVAAVRGTSVAAVDDDVFTLCHNPVIEDDHDACGVKGFYHDRATCVSTLYWVEAVQQGGPLGYGPSVTDPETGEIIAGRAFNYGEGMGTYANYGLDVIRFINGDIDGDDLKNAEFAREDVLARARATTDLDKVSPRLKDAPIKRVKDLDPVRMARREEHRRNLERFSPEDARRKLELAKSAGLSSMLGGEEYDRAMSSAIGVPIEDLPEEQRAAFDPISWLNPTQLKAMREKRRKANSRSVDYADMIDPNILGLARKYEGRQDYDQVWRELRAEIFKATALHEVGHTVGLRHNFQGSFDSMNFHDEYWDLRQETMTENVTSMADLYGLSALSEAQIDGRMREYQYSSIMDYGLTFNSDLQGLGRYDKAALLYGYTAGSRVGSGACDGVGEVEGVDGGCLVRNRGMVEVYAKKRGELGEAGEILTSRDEFGFPFDDPHSVIVPYNERWHYTTVMKAFPEFEDAFDREWMWIEDFWKERDAWEEGEDVDPPVRVPYLFCSDEWAGALLSCQLFDSGADPYEVTRNITNDYRNYYYFTNFKRDRLGWDPINALFSYFYNTFLPLSDVFQNWYLAPEGADDVMDNYWWFATNMAYNLIAEAIATPPYGTYCRTPEGRLFNLSDEAGQTREQTSAYYREVYCQGSDDLFEVAQGDGRRRFSTYNVDSGYNFAFQPLEAGHYWTTLAAFWALVDPDAYVLGSDADVGTFAISFYDFFRDDIHRLVNAVVTENYDDYSPVLEIVGEGEEGNKLGKLHFPVMSPVYDGDRTLFFNPETGQAVDEGMGPSRATTAPCEPCTVDTACTGHTGFIGGTYCQPIDDSGDLFCLQDCTDAPELCREGETCDAIGNCVPDDGTCAGKVSDCGAADPNGKCPTGQVCQAGSCIDLWPIVETDATFSLVDDMMFYGMLYTTFSFSTRYNDQINIFKMGTNETITPGEGFVTMQFVDPIGGDAYGAVVEDCGAGDPGTLGGPTGMCQPCDVHAECAGFADALGGAYCQPLADEDGDWFCFIDCTNEGATCPDDFSCNDAGNCVPDAGSCDGLGVECGPDAPFGACAEGETCIDGACATIQEPDPVSARCTYNLTQMSGAAQMVERGQTLAARYDETLGAYYADDGSDPVRETQRFREFSRARFELESHIEKINDIRAVYAIFGKVY